MNATKNQALIKKLIKMRSIATHSWNISTTQQLCKKLELTEQNL
jgi:hypothetical protein